MFIAKVIVYLKGNYGVQACCKYVELHVKL